jgi:hypothetical protein
LFCNERQASLFRQSPRVILNGDLLCSAVF